MRRSKATRRIALLAAAAVFATGFSQSAAFGTVPPRDVPSSTDAPVQRSGSATGLAHSVAASATEDVAGARAARPKGTAGTVGPKPAAVVRPRGQGVQAQKMQPIASAPTAPRKSAFDPARSREQVGRRTATSKTYQNPDGTSTLIEYGQPVNYQKPDGSWASIDSSLTPVADGQLATRATQDQIQVAASAGAPSVESFGVDAGHRVAFGLAGAATAPATVSGSTALYSSVFPHTDLRVTAGSDFLKEEIVLRSPAAGDSWTFPLHTDGLTPALRGDGSVAFTDAAGAVRLVVPAAWMEDSAKNAVSGFGAQSAAVAYSLVPYGGGVALKVTADRAWLDDKARKYPVTIDPTVDQQVNATSSTYVDSSSSRNHEHEANLLVGSDGTKNYNTFLAFGNLYTQLQNAEVTAAALHLYQTSGASSVPITVSPVATNWNVDTLVAYPGPGVASPVGQGTTVATGWSAIGLNPLFVKSCTKAPSPYACGMAVTAETADTNGFRIFASTSSANVPWLQVDYAIYAATYDLGNGVVSPSVTNVQQGRMEMTLTNASTATWSTTFKLGYHLYDANNNELSHNAPLTPMPQAVPPGGSIDTVGAIGALPPATYKVCWDMQDSSGDWFSQGGVTNPPDPCAGNASFALVVDDIPPVLDTVYPGDGYQFSTLTPTLSATAHDPDDWPAAPLQYRFHLNAATITDSGWLSTPQWTIPPGQVNWGDNFIWWVEVQETNGQTTTTGQSSVMSASVQVPQRAVVSHLGGGGSATHGADPLTGDYTTSAVDASVSTVGPLLQVQRTYNSLDPRTATMFGEGWSNPYDASIAADHSSSNAEDVTYPDGEVVVFGLDSDGTYAAPAGRQAELAKGSDGLFSLTDKDGTTFKFTAAGRLGTITDAQQRSVTLTYDGGGDLATVKSNTSQRMLHFTWTVPTGAQFAHVTTVATDPVTPGSPTSALTWTYSYAGDALSGVCPPTSATACTTYGYVPGLHYRSGVVDANPLTYLPLSDAAFTGNPQNAAPMSVESGYWDATGVTAATDHPLPNDTDTAASFNGAAFLNAGMGEPGASSYQTVELWFKTTHAGGVLYSYEPLDYERTPPASTDPKRPALYIGTDGHLRGGFNGSASGSVMTSSASLTDGQWHYVALMASGQTQFLYVDGQVQGSAGAPALLPSATNVLLGKGFIDSSYPAAATAPTTTPWYFQGEISQFAFYNYALSSAQESDHYAAAHTNVSLLHTITLPSGKNYATVQYNTGADRVSQLTDENGGVWQLDGGSFSRGSVTYQDQVLANRPLDYYPLDEYSGSVAHSVVYHDDSLNHNATYNNVMYQDAGSPCTGNASTYNIGPAVRLDGSTSYIQLPDNELTSTGPFAVEIGFYAWTTGQGVLVATQDRTLSDPQAPSTPNPLLYVGTDGVLYAQVPGAGNTVLTGKQTRVGAWQDAELILPGAAGGDALLYQNGQLVNSQTEFNPTTVSTRYAYAGAGYIPAGLPGAPANPRSYFNGDLGNLSVYDTSVSGNEPQEAGLSCTEGSPEDTVTVTDPASKTIVYTYDMGSGGQITSKTDQAGGLTSYTYDTHGFLASVTDPDGHTTGYVNDIRGNPIWTSVCRGPQQCETSGARYYGEWNNLPAASLDPRVNLRVRMTDANNALTTYTYDSAGNLYQTTTPPTTDYPNGRTTTSLYTASTTSAYGGGVTPAGLVMSTTTPAGAATTFQYYSNGDVARVTSPDGLVTTYAYDTLGRATTQTQTWPGGPAQGAVTTAIYDGQNRMVDTSPPATTDRFSGVTHIPVDTTLYDVDGDILSVSENDYGGGDSGGDPSRTTTNTYDAHDHLATTQDAAGNTTHYTSYDLFGNVTAMTDAAGDQYVDTYGPTGQLWTTVLKGYTGADPLNPQSPQDLTLVSNAYDPAGRLATSTDAMGRVRHYHYYDDNRVAQVTADGFHNSDGTTRNVDLTDYSYDPAGNLIGLTNGGGKNHVDYTYDVSGRQTRAADADGTVTDATYDADGNVSRVAVHDAQVTSPTTTNSSITDYTYDAEGNVLTKTLHGGLVGTIAEETTYTRDARGLQLSVTDPQGNVTGAVAANYTTHFGYDEAGRLVTTTLPPVSVESNGSAPTTVSPTTTTGYDTFGDAVESLDARGLLSSTVYDGLGRPVTSYHQAYTAPGTSTAVVPYTTNTYTALGQVKTTKDAAGATTTYAYNQLGGLATRTDPLVSGAPAAGVWTYAYDNDGELLTSTDPTHAQAAATYDDLGRPVTSTSLVRSGSVTNAYTAGTEYDDAGNVTAATDPDGNRSTASYDAGNRLSWSADPLGDTTHVQYDYLSMPILVQAPDNTAQTSTVGTDGLVYQTSQLDAGNAVLSTQKFTYDAAGNTLTWTDPNNAVWTRSYDALNRLTTQVEPVAAGQSITTSYGYDAAGNQTRFTDGRGNNFLTTYNSWELPESGIEPSTTAYPNAADRTWTTSYDIDGRPTTMTEPGGVTRSTVYDALGRVTDETGSGAEAATAAHHYTYDLAGRLLSTAAQGGTDTFTYDDRGLLQTTGGPSGTSSFVYDPAGLMQSRMDTSGTATYQYDADRRLKTLTDPLTNTTESLHYDTMSQLRTVNYGSGATRTLGYDTQHRITSDVLTAPGGTVEASIGYGYDPDGRLASKNTFGTAGAAQNTYQYDLAGRLTSWTSGSTTTAYGYDASGNRTSAGGVTAVFDARNRLQSSGSTTYTYSARGTRLSQTTGSTTTQSTYDAFDRMITDGGTANAYDGLDRLVSTGSTALSYSGMGNTPSSVGSSQISRGPGDGVVAVKKFATAAALAMTDRHDDVVALFTASGSALAGSAAYDPFGQVLAAAGTQSPAGYQSEWTDPASGKVDMASRWYDPASGAFTSRDTVSQGSSPSVAANAYAYGGQDPLDNIDPSGHCWIICGAIIGAAFSAATYTVNWLSDPKAKWSWGDFAYQTGKGALEGAVFSATAGLGSFAAGAISSDAGYAMDCIAGHPCSAGGAVTAGVEGGTVALVSDGIVKGAGKALGKLKGALSDGADVAATDGADDAADDAAHDTADGVGGEGADAIGDAPESTADDLSDRYGPKEAHNAGVEAAAKAAAEAAAKVAAEKAAEKAAAEKAYQEWLHSPAGKAAQVAKNEGSDVAAAQTQHAADKMVPQSALPAAPTTSLADDLARAAHRVADNSSAVITGVEDSSVNATGAAVDDGASGVEAGDLGSASDPVEPSDPGNGESCDGPYHSFTGSTPVEMGDGSTKPISQIKVGDVVTDSQPGAVGEKETHRVDDVIVTRTDHDFVDVSVATAEGVRTISTTYHHPFYDITQGKFVDAQDLKVGDVLQSADGTTVVTAVRLYHGTQVTYDLTIDGLHTYFVVAGDMPVLVHNCTIVYDDPETKRLPRDVRVCELVCLGIKKHSEQLAASLDSHTFNQGNTSGLNFGRDSTTGGDKIWMIGVRKAIASAKNGGGLAFSLGGDTGAEDPLGKFMFYFKTWINAPAGTNPWDDGYGTAWEAYSIAMATTRGQVALSDIDWYLPAEGKNPPVKLDGLLPDGMSQDGFENMIYDLLDQRNSK